MNMPNKLTLTRVVLSLIFVFLLLVDDPYLKIVSFAIYLIAALTDIIDGHIARKYGEITGFGKFMDPLADKVLVSAALIALVALDYARAWMVVLIIAREFHVTAIRSLAALKGIVIQASNIAKFKTVLQMAAITYFLMIITFDAYGSIAGIDIRLMEQFNYQLSFDIVLGIATLITVVTGVDYTVKYYSMLKASSDE